MEADKEILETGDRVRVEKEKKRREKIVEGFIDENMEALNELGK